MCDSIAFFWKTKSKSNDVCCSESCSYKGNISRHIYWMVWIFIKWRAHVQSWCDLDHMACSTICDYSPFQYLIFLLRRHMLVIKHEWIDEVPSDSPSMVFAWWHLLLEPTRSPPSDSNPLSTYALEPRPSRMPCLKLGKSESWKACQNQILCLHQEKQHSPNLRWDMMHSNVDDANIWW